MTNIKFTKEGIAIIKGDNCICKWVEESGRLDQDQNALPQILKFINPDDVVVDAGAFIGDHTIAYANAVGNKGYVYAIEPDSDAYICLQQNMRKLSNVLPLKLALGSKICKKSMVTVPENAGMNYLCDGSDVHVFTLDGLGFQKVDFIKIDVEGGELGVLHGAKQTIKSYKPHLLIEINTMTLNRAKVKRSEIFGFLLKYGYTFRNIYAEQDCTGDQIDIICIHDDRLKNDTDLCNKFTGA